MEDNSIFSFCTRKYTVITLLIIIFGFLLYLVEYEDIGSKLQMTNHKFNFAMTKHTFLVKEFKYNNGVLEVIGNYEDASSSKENVVLSLRNLSSNQYPKIHMKTTTSSSKENVVLSLKNLSSTHSPKIHMETTTQAKTTTKSTTIAMATSSSKKPKQKQQNKSIKLPTSFLFKTERMHKTIDCAKLIEGDDEEQDIAKHLMEKPKESVGPEVFINLTRDCGEFRKRYITSSLTKEEENFPIAYSILVFKDVDQVERLLRSIYRPQNYYCIHIDIKSKKSFQNAVTKISSCFENVFVTTKSVDVRWGTFTVLEPELLCLKELWKYKKWKYFINLTGQEFPLRTNLELVKILKIYNGANDMEGTVKRANKNRWEKAGKPPHDIIPTKGSVHITANRDFVDYVLHNQTAKDFLEWVKKVDVPDETFFTSLNHNPHLQIRGSYTGEPETDSETKPFLTRFKNWGMDPFNWDCHGQRVRLICVFGVGDLPLLSKRPELFANKFYNYYEPFALDCMEELHYNRTRDEYLKKTVFNTTFYENLEFIKHIIR